MASGSDGDRDETRWVIFLFGGLLAFHLWGTSVGWKNLNLPGVEFRQTQTAISAYYIQKDHDFSLAYPTPVLGKPWSIPLEFPLYQWTVVVVSNTTGLDLTKSGRLVSLACFYLSLPAVFLLLEAWIPDRRRRLLVLGVILSSPFYIFYSRSFLMETMALMASLWFLIGYLRAIRTGKWYWLLAAAVFGSIAGLVKVTTFMLYLGPAAGWTLWSLWRSRPSSTEPGWDGVGRILVRGTVATLVPFALTLAWIRFADATKALNPAADFLLSSHLTDYNFGSAETRFSPELWRGHWQILSQVVLRFPLLVAGGIIIIVFSRRRWRQVAICLGCFAGVQMVFPVLYALHEYYYIANALFLLVAIGIALIGALESRLPRFVAWLLVGGFITAQMGSYFQGLYALQRAPSTGGSPITQALRVATEPDDLLIVAGQDWCANTPYFAQRRALMFRTGIERDSAVVARDFEQLRGEKIGALVLAGVQRDNRELLERVVRDFGIDPRPVFTSLDATIYFHRRLRLAAIALIKTVPDAPSIHLTEESVSDEHALMAHEVELAQLPESYAHRFADMSPQPFKFYATFGLKPQMVEGREMLFSHPDTRLWFRAGAGRRTIRIEVELLAAAYAESVATGDRSDGIEVLVSAEGPGGVRRPLFSREVNPRDRVADRGLQTLTQDFDLAKDEVIVVGVGPGPRNNLARDWAMLGKIEIK